MSKSTVQKLAKYFKTLFAQNVGLTISRSNILSDHPESIAVGRYGNIDISRLDLKNLPDCFEKTYEGMTYRDLLKIATPSKKNKRAAERYVVPMVDDGVLVIYCVDNEVTFRFLSRFTSREGDWVLRRTRRIPPTSKLLKYFESFIDRHPEQLLYIRSNQMTFKGEGYEDDLRNTISYRFFSAGYQKRTQQANQVSVTMHDYASELGCYPINVPMIEIRSKHIKDSDLEGGHVKLKYDSCHWAEYAIELKSTNVGSEHGELSTIGMEMATVVQEWMSHNPHMVLSHINRMTSELSEIDKRNCGIMTAGCYGVKNRVWGPIGISSVVGPDRSCEQINALSRRYDIRWAGSGKGHDRIVFEINEITYLNVHMFKGNIYMVLASRSPKQDNVYKRYRLYSEDPIDRLQAALYGLEVLHPGCKVSSGTVLRSGSRKMEFFTYGVLARSEDTAKNTDTTFLPYRYLDRRLHFKDHLPLCFRPRTQRKGERYDCHGIQFSTWDHGDSDSDRKYYHLNRRLV